MSRFDGQWFESSYVIGNWRSARNRGLFRVNAEPFLAIVNFPFPSRLTQSDEISLERTKKLELKKAGS